VTTNTARTILVVEDYSDSRALLSAFLRNKGYTVIEAENGQEGIEEAARAKPDLILMDLAMPELDGVEAIRRIRQNPEIAETPIFVVSAYMMAGVEQDVQQAGGTEIFEKPLDVNALLERIEAELI
jgi:two-component system, cell cycle response regulator DivK